jgi:hypothetical protein
MRPARRTPQGHLREQSVSLGALSRFSLLFGRLKAGMMPMGKAEEELGVHALIAAQRAAYDRFDAYDRRP